MPSLQKAGEMANNERSLADDRLPSIEAIAEYVEGEANPTTVRRIRHLIAHHGFPAMMRGGRWQSRKSWADRYYEEPDQAADRKVLADAS
jgi:hypothetical protein